MYQELIHHTWQLRGERYAKMARDIIRILQAQGADDAVVDAGAYYYLYGGANNPVSALERYDLSPTTLAMLAKLQCSGLKSNQKPGSWQTNIRRFYFHVREDLVGNKELEMVQAAISESRVANYHCKANYGKGLTFLAAELLYVQRFTHQEYAERVYRAIRQKADNIGFRREDIEARTFQLQGFVCGLYQDIYHSNVRPAKSVTLPNNWRYTVQTEAVNNA